jgi:hypothetical protein
LVGVEDAVEELVEDSFQEETDDDVADSREVDNEEELFWVDDEEELFWVDKEEELFWVDKEEELFWVDKEEELFWVEFSLVSISEMQCVCRDSSLFSQLLQNWQKDWQLLFLEFGEFLQVTALFLQRLVSFVV